MGEDSLLDDINVYVQQSMFKYKLNQIVFYLKDNKVHSSKVLARSCIDYDQPWRAAQSPDLGECGIFYLTCHGKFPQGQVYESKEELLKSL